MRHVALPGVVDQHVRAAKTIRYRIGKGLHLVFFQDVAAVRENLRSGILVLQRGMRAGEPVGIAAAKATFAPSPSSRRSVSKPIPDDPPVTTATRPSICAFIAHLFPYP
jgi:hypothetical protein